MNFAHAQRWDIFCRVIDNYGDIGVSWRLARQLAVEHGLAVRLWVDQPASLHALCPRVDMLAREQRVDGVTIFQLNDEAQYPPPGDVVIEAFGCGLPPRYLDALAGSEPKPLWIVLEYLSAEPWVPAHHGLPSPHPQLNVPRNFFFPGVARGTGGVLRERDLLARRDAFDAAARRAWWSRWGFDDVAPGTLVVSLFAYANAPVKQLMDACVASVQPVTLVLSQTPLAVRVRQDLGVGDTRVARAGVLEVRFLPFVPQAEYDALLWACDINFVRGEDSFVRAQWAAKPFVWHIYPQADNAHVPKLDAFLHVFGEVLEESAAQAVRGLWHAWNGVGGAPPFADAWAAFCRGQSAQRQALGHWQRQLEGIGDLAGNLVKFCANPV